MYMINHLYKYNHNDMRRAPSRKHLNRMFTCGKLNSFFFFNFYFLLKYSGFTAVLVCIKVIQLYMYPYIYSFSDTSAL